MATVLDIIRGISQAAANSYDGAHDERMAADGEARTAGLKREEGDMNLEARVMDGFSLRVQGTKLIVSYHSQIKLKDVHDRGRFESDIAAHLNDIVKYVKKEYKKVTGDTLSLKKEGDPVIRVEHMNRVRTWVTANQTFNIGNLKGVENGEMVDGSPKDRLDQAIQDWLELGKKAPKAKNDTRKKEN